MKTILLVDDEPDIRSVLRMRLERTGYHVLEAETGVQALDVVYTAHPDLLVLDWSLPGLSGIEVLKTIRANQASAGLIVFMVSGMDETVIHHQLHGLGIYASFEKPFSPGAMEQEKLSLRFRRTHRRIAGDVLDLLHGHDGHFLGGIHF
jgi:two-component system, OmpR family, alkaline phosphatase synthesis response regulator PhoP